MQIRDVLKNCGIIVTFEKSTLIINLLTHRQENVGSCLMPCSQFQCIWNLAEEMNTSSVFLQLELLIRLWGMKSYRNGGLCPNPGSTGLRPFPRLPEWCRSLLRFSREVWWQSFRFNSSRSCWEEHLVYVLFSMPVRSPDEILSINHKAYYCLKYLHLSGEGPHWLPAGETNGASLLAGTLSLGKHLRRHRSCSVCCGKCAQI